MLSLMRFSMAADGLFLRLQGLEFLLRRFARAALEVVDQLFEGFLDDGGGDGLVLFRLVGGDFLRGFHGLGQFALGLADLGLQRFDRVGLGLEKLGDEVFVGNQGVVPAGGDDGLEVVADLLPPVHENPGALELVEHAQGNELALDGGEQLVADLGHLLAVAELGKVVAGHGPPGLQRVVVSGERLLERGIGFQRGLDGGLGVDRSTKGEVAGALGLEERVGLDAELGEVALPGLHLRLGNAADQVGLHVLRLRVGRVVHVAADVEVVVVLLDDLGLVHEAAVFRQSPACG